jgi:hypothetical protein
VVECNLAKVDVESSNLFSRSKQKKPASAGFSVSELEKSLGLGDERVRLCSS